MDIVAKVAEEIAEIPGNPSAMEIARIAIEAYQNAIWPPLLDLRAPLPPPNLRQARADQLTAQIMQIIGKYLCQHGDHRPPRDAVRDLYETFCEAGVEIITDADRAAAGLEPRGPYGLTMTELCILELRRREALLQPIIVKMPFEQKD
jgi:hypothetical protein